MLYKSSLDTEFIEFNQGGVQYIWHSISDREGIRVGIQVKGMKIAFMGDKPNKFTGDAFVSGRGRLSLARSNGGSVKGDVFLRENSQLGLDFNNQMPRTSNIELEDSKIYFWNNPSKTVINIVNRLTVKGESLFIFDNKGQNNAFYLNDLLITEGSRLRIRWWDTGQDHLLVRKDSEHLEESLKRIKFEGRRELMGSVRDFDKDYWEIIPGMPEPATYGAILGATGLGLWTLKRRSRESAQKGEAPMKALVRVS